MPYDSRYQSYFGQRQKSRIIYNLIEFGNDVAGSSYVMASGSEGPYNSKDFTIGGVTNTYPPVACKVPDVVTQNKNSTRLGSLQFARIGDAVLDYVMQIRKSAQQPSDNTIRVRMLVVEESQVGNDYVLYDKNVFAASSGVSIDDDNVTIGLQYDNPARSFGVPIYEAQVYTGLRRA